MQTTLKASYTNHYCHGLIKLLDVLGFESANAAHRPVIDAIALVRRYAGRPERYYPIGEHVPVDGVVAEAWRDPLYRVDNCGRSGSCALYRGVRLLRPSGPAALQGDLGHRR